MPTLETAMTDMDNQQTSAAKLAKPHAFFAEPHDVLTDPALSKEQKTEILATLEQDARQMVAASDEGMTGGELGKLHDVLVATNTLALPPVAHAYDLVLNDLRSRVKDEASSDARAVIQLALTAIEAAMASLASHIDAASAAAIRTASAKACFDAGIADEIAREKLDP